MNLGGVIIFIIVISIVAIGANMFKAYQNQQKSQTGANTNQTPRNIWPGATGTGSSQSARPYTTPSASGQPVYIPRSQTSGARLGAAPGRTDSSNYEQRKTQTDEMLRRAGYGNDTAADMVDSVDSYSMNHLGIHDPMRCEEISPDDFTAKKTELRSLLASGIISKKEHDMILREYQACLRGNHYGF